MERILVLFLTFLSIVLCDPPLQVLLKFLKSGDSRLMQELPDQHRIRSEYDFIIVGAGSAGCAVANRLSENPKWNILLLEAGQGENLFMDIPMVVHYLQAYKINWGYKTERSENFCLAMNNNQCNWPRGKVMGGSSVLNFMIYTRGNKRDYDNWADLGNTGWDFKNVSHYFRKLENNIVSDATPGYHGSGGPVTVSSIKFKSPTADAFVQAGVEKGSRYVDYNGPSQVGFSYLQATIANGTRDSTNVAYLYPIAGRRNLHVKKFSHVTKLLIDAEKRVYGVTFFSRGQNYSVNASKEVILSAGAINTPQILMLSGIGSTKHLKKMGIETVVNSAVGYNLMDHPAPGALTFTVNSTTLNQIEVLNLDILEQYVNNLDGPLASAGGSEAIAFMDTENPNDPDAYPDLELLHIGGSIDHDQMLKRNFGIRDDFYHDMFANLKRGSNTFMVFPMVMRPKSRGRIKLQSSDPFAHPIILPNYFTDPYDIKIAIRGIRKMIDLIDTKAFRKVNAEFLKLPIKGCENFAFNSDGYWECYTRHLTFTVYHHCGTAKMGPDSDKRAVVDPSLRVYGVRGLRVADASIMPVIVSGHTNAPTIMIGEKAADMIKATWGER